MAGQEIPETRAQLTGTGTADGLIAVADATLFYPGTKGWLSNGTPAQSREVLILRRVSATQLMVRLTEQPYDSTTSGLRLSAPSYGVSDMSGFTVAFALIVPRQYAPNNFIG